MLSQKGTFAGSKPNWAIWSRRGLALVFLLPFVLFNIHCATSVPEPPSQEAPKPSRHGKRLFKTAYLNYKKGNRKTAADKFLAYLRKYPKTNRTDDAYYYLGQIYYDLGQTEKAKNMWMTLINGEIASQHYDRSVLNASMALIQLGRPKESLELIRRFRVDETTKKGLRIKAHKLQATAKLQVGDPMGALLHTIEGFRLTSKRDEKKKLLSKASEIVYSHLTENQLEDVASENRFSPVRTAAQFKLGVILYEQKNWASAKSHFALIVETVPQSALGEKARQYLKVINTQTRTSSRTIGAILPLSGKYKQMGYRTLRGIQLALNLHQGSSTFKLAIIDSEGNPDLARRGVERLVSEDHVVGIIGGVLGRTAQAAAIKCQEFGVPCITLSQKKGLVDIGDFVFRNALTAKYQMADLVGLAMEEKGFKKFAVLYPNDRYGVDYATAFWDQVLMRGGEVVGAQTYPSKETDFRKVISKLVGTYYGDRDEEKELRLKEWKEDPQNKRLRAEPPKDLMPPIVRFDAIFIPDNAKTTGQIAAMLAYSEVNDVPLLGTNLWNTKEILKRGGKRIENALFVDAFYKESGKASQTFVRSFQNRFKYVPDVFEARGYDAAKVFGSVISSSGFSISRRGLRNRIAELSGVNGATGPLSMSSTREVQKQLIPLTVLDGSIVQFRTQRGG